MRKLIKKLSAIALSFTVILGSTNVVAYADTKGIDLYMFGEKVDIKDEPYISKDGRTMVPLRFVAESFGVDVVWNNENQSINISNGFSTLNMKVGAKEASLDGMFVELSSAPVFKSGRVYIALTDVASNFGADVRWDKDEKAVYIDSPVVDFDENLEKAIFEILESDNLNKLTNNILESDNLKLFGMEIYQSKYLEDAINDVIDSENFEKIFELIYESDSYKKYVAEVEATEIYKDFIKKAEVDTLFITPKDIKDINDINEYLSYNKKLFTTPGYMELTFEMTKLDSYKEYMEIMMSNEELLSVMEDYFMELEESEALAKLLEEIENSKYIDLLINEILSMPEYLKLIEEMDKLVSMY